MSIQAIAAVLIVTLATVLFISGRVRPDLVALGVLVILPLSGLLPPETALGSFGNPIVITLIAVFILGRALNATGVSHRIGLWLQRHLGASEGQLRVGLILAGSGLSLFMNNVAAVAVLMPAALDVARRQERSPSRLLLPLAFATQLAGMATLFTTANLITGEFLSAAGYPRFGVLDFLPVGGPVALAGLVYLALIGWRPLPRRSAQELFPRRFLPQEELPTFYALGERLWEVTVLPEAAFAGQTLAASAIGQRWGLTVLEICYHDRLCAAPTTAAVLEPGATLIVAGREERIRELGAAGALFRPASNEVLAQVLSKQAGMVEVLIPPHSRAAGQTLHELHFREQYGLTVVALWRENRSYRTDVGTLPLRVGDALLVYGPPNRLQLLQQVPDYLPLMAEQQWPRPGKAPWAVLALAGALILAATGIAPTALALLLGAVVTLATGCVTPDEAYEAIDWRSVFIIAGMIPAGLALSQTGAAAWLAQQVLVLTRPLGPAGPVCGLLALTTLLTQLIPGGAAVPTLLVPIAIQAAAQAGLDARALALGIAIVTGAAFSTPFGHPANLMVLGPGGYTGRDYLRSGGPLVLLTFGVTLLLLLMKMGLQ